MKTPPLALSKEVTRWLWVLAFIGLGGTVAGFVLAPAKAWTGYLTSAFYFLSLALGGLVTLALLHLTKAGWSVVLRRVVEGIAGYLPVGAASMLVVLLGVSTLYPWAGSAADDPAIHAKAAYLNVPGFAIRMAIVLTLWLLFAALFRRASVAQDGDRRVAHTARSVALSAVFLLTFAYSFSVAAFDWIMSLEPHWQSTIFAWQNLAGLWLSGLAAITVAIIFLRRANCLPQVNENHLHDLAKLIFGMSTFWAYLWISQYLLIWYANIPEETAYYLARTHHGWGFLFYANLIVNWLVPFLALLPRRAKRSEPHLLRVCGLLLFGRWLDLYLMIAPSSSPEHAGIGVLELAPFVGFAALFVLVVVRTLRAAPLIPAGDPYLVESLHHHQ